MASLGLIFIFILLARKGPIYLSIVSTSRSLFTVLLSIFTSDATLTNEQTAGITIVFGYLIIENIYTAWTPRGPLAQSKPDTKKLK